MSRIEDSLEVKLSTIWRDEKQSREVESEDEKPTREVESETITSSVISNFKA